MTVKRSWSPSPLINLLFSTFFKLPSELIISELLITTVKERALHWHIYTRTVIGKLVGSIINKPVPKKLKGRIAVESLGMYWLVNTFQMFPTRCRIHKIIRLLKWHKEVCIIDQDKNWIFPCRFLFFSFLFNVKIQKCHWFSFCAYPHWIL